MTTALVCIMQNNGRIKTTIDQLIAVISCYRDCLSGTCLRGPVSSPLLLAYSTTRDGPPLTPLTDSVDLCLGSLKNTVIYFSQFHLNFLLRSSWSEWAVAAARTTAFVVSQVSRSLIGPGSEQQFCRSLWNLPSLLCYDTLNNSRHLIRDTDGFKTSRHVPRGALPVPDHTWKINTKYQWRI